MCIRCHKELCMSALNRQHSWCLGVFAQEKDLRVVPEGGGEKDVTVYLGLAAAAFLLLTLYPSKTPADASVSLHGGTCSDRSSGAAVPSGGAEAGRKGSGGLPHRASSPALLMAMEGTESTSLSPGGPE